MAKKITNFPKKGDNLKVSLRNSNYKLFDIDFALDLKKRFPSLWKKGGNTLGNKQFNRLRKIVKDQRGKIRTRTDEKAVRIREQWSARHYKDFRIAGVIAQIKWLLVGNRGMGYQKKLVNEYKGKLRKTNEIISGLEKDNVVISDSLYDFILKSMEIDCIDTRLSIVDKAIEISEEIEGHPNDLWDGIFGI